eukprot:TRINITY_DN13151_c0_g1_i1.p1 TRINITY_DN13151_c0_g1~~TRINITY_DN13151_c0_g1_i1.p1  ORF type:complete len:196 (-),score=18.89 TRINITY_DN13151_c0_g1_i1:472-1059(-)
MFGLLRRGVRHYAERLRTRPYTTQMATGGVLWAVGDGLSQTLASDEPFDWRRLCRMGIYGTVVAGPLYCWWYDLLDRKTIGYKPSGWSKYLGAKIFADQCIFEPPHLVIFFTSTGLLEGQGFEKIKDQIKEDFAETYFCDCLLWPFAQALNFRFVPVVYQALVVNIICVGWNAFLSHVKHREVISDKKSPWTPPW